MKNNLKSTSILSGLRVIIPLVLLVIVMIARPAASFGAARAALALWYSVVVPSLLPFFIISEMLISLGAARLAGRLLSPLMRPVFNLPGAASLAVLMGFFSGFPTGAAVTAGLRRENLVSKSEAERLVAFTNNAGPLYITVAVATGLLNCPSVALTLAVTHYGLNLLLGIVLGLLSRRRDGPSGMPQPDAASAPAAPFAVLLKTAAQRAAANIVLIGCYMIFFAIMASMFSPPGLAEQHPLLAAHALGVWEMSLGINALANSGLPLGLILPLIATQLAFGGFSIQAQVLAMIAESDISPRLYLLSRLLHAALALLLTAALISQSGLALPSSALALNSFPPQPLYLAGGTAGLALWFTLWATARLITSARAGRPKKNI